MAAPTAPLRIDPVVCGEAVPSRDRTRLDGVDGTPLADIGTAPRLLAQAAVNRMRRSSRGATPGPEVFAEAGRFFAESELDGETPADYRRRVSAATGAPVAVVDRAIEGIRDSLGQVERLNSAELPQPFAVPGFETRWVPRGLLLAAIVPNNHPEPNVSWVRALALGYSVAVRPGSRDPFTPRRLVSALLAAGLPPQRVSLLPGSHDLGEHLLAQADLGLFYGGPDAVERWRTRSDVLVRGPGRSKALVDVPVTGDLVDDLVDWIADDAGVRCNNTSAVLVHGDHTALADQLAERLAKLPLLHPRDPEAVLPAISLHDADAMREYLRDLTREAVDHSARHYADGPVAETVDGTVLMRPLVVSVDDPSHPLVGTELPFPFVVVAPWREEDGVAVLRDSLVVSVLSERQDLVEALVLEPSVRKVVVGRTRPWTSLPELPHDGSLAGFLMEPKAYVNVAATA
ncbi:aldehyde dehydrogenase family protein [Thermobifida cellulosilytica]|uniref:Arylcarboxylate reductase n=1 Tax=Thermobifida cellulosilytica TB100 TaxID=665004 RepID=A0A147KJ10_THECS|nr:aldehyde dehydrogenase family protein [Thermobifida cellulosilytica]KUP97292.1 arylcarboxylate reductase [Thermobifida cellulosilytica TB100]